MSWHTAKKRFERDLDKAPARIRDFLQKKQLKWALPTFDQELPPRTLPVHEQKTGIQQGITDGDLVYLTKGPKKGEIATVSRYLPNFGAYVLTNSTTKKLFPKSHWVEGQLSHVSDYPEFVPRENVKLAGREKDPETGKITYLVADDVHLKEEYYDDRYKKWIPKRFVKHHLSIEIPWPNPPNVEDGALSTREDVVFEKTFEMQTLARPPVPAGALDQIRNPHSKHKKRIFSKMQVGRMRTPEMPLSVEQKLYLSRKEKSEQEAAQKAKPKELSQEIQDFLGQKMAEHINNIDNPYMLAHLELLSSKRNQEFEKLQKQ